MSVGFTFETSRIAFLSHSRTSFQTLLKKVINSILAMCICKKKSIKFVVCYPMLSLRHNLGAIVLRIHNRTDQRPVFINRTPITVIWLTFSPCIMSSKYYCLQRNCVSKRSGAFGRQ